MDEDQARTGGDYSSYSPTAESGAVSGRRVHKAIQPANKRQWLIEQIVAAEHRLESLLHPVDRFERGERSIENSIEKEMTILPYFEALTDSEDNYEIECRSAICRITSDSKSDWSSAVQGDLGRLELFAFRTFDKELAAPETIAERIPWALARGLTESGAEGALKSCRAKHRALGAVTLHIDYVPQSRTYVVRGVESNMPLEECIGAEARRLISRMWLPPGELPRRFSMFVDLATLGTIQIPG